MLFIIGFVLLFIFPPIGIILIIIGLATADNSSSYKDKMSGSEKWILQKPGSEASTIQP